MTMSKCQFPNCVNNAIDEVHCIGHAKMLAEPDLEQKARKGIRPMSVKTEHLMKTLQVRKKAYLAKEENKICLIQSVECTKDATTINHKKRRGINLLEEKYWEPCCKKCNIYIEQHHAWAVQNGHLQSVHKVERVIPVEK